MHRALSVALVLGILAVGGSPASAQSFTPRGVVGVNVGAQASTITLADTATFTQFVEEGTLRSATEVGAGLLVDGGLSARLWRGLGVGIAVSRFRTSTVADVTLEAPHPFFFDRPRTFADSPELERQAVGVHLAAVYLVPASDRVQVAVSGGPSVFSLSQDLVTDVSFDERFPFDDLVDPRVVIRRQSETAVGFNAGVDVAIRLGDRWGVGLLARYARASVDLAPSADVVGARTVATDVGGFHIGGGLRLFF